MKKTLAIIFTSALSLTCNNAKAQHTASIIGGASVYLDKPFKFEFQEQPEHYQGTLTEFKRTQGYYIGYASAFKLKNELSIEVSPQFNFTQDEIKLLDSEYNMDMTNGHDIYTGNVNERTEKGFSIGCMVPVSLKKKLFDSPLSISAGINFTADRLVYNTSYNGFEDPAFEKYYRLFKQYNDTLPHDELWSRYKHAPYKSRFGIGAQLGLEYQIGRFALTGSFVTTNLNQTPANAVSLGLKYNLKSKPNPKLSDSTRMKFKHSIGFSNGQSIGKGISYRYVPHKFGVQVSAGPGYGTSWNGANGSVSFLYKFFEVERMNFYAYQSNLFAYDKQKFNETTGQQTNTFKDSSFGIGLGNEINLFGHFYLNLMASLAYKTAYSKYESSNQSTNSYQSSKTELLVENALYYKF